MIQQLVLGLVVGVGGLGLVLAQNGQTTPPSAGGHTHATPAVPATPPPATTSTAGAPTYHQDIRPILEASCTGCHAPGGIAPFSLRDADTARRMAPAIAAATTSRHMPPWMPGPASPALQHDRRLTDAEIAKLAAWAKAGAPLGDPAKAAPLRPTRVPEVRNDLTLRGAAYTPDRTMTDDYRCFVLETDLPSDRFVTGYDVLPERTDQVHHVILFQVGAEGREEARRRDGADGRPGWTCFGGPGVGGSTGLPGVIGSWTPGTVPTAYPEGTGVKLARGAFVVMQVHYNLAAGTAPDRTAVRLQLAPEAAAVEPLSLLVYAAPVEIPCEAGSRLPACDRREALRQAVRDDGPNALTRVQGLLTLCQKTPQDFAAQSARAVTSTCDRTVRRDAAAVGAILHMHTRGAATKLVLNPGTPTEKVLLDIPAWDFHWQGSYFYEQPIRLKAGDTVRISCTWDNTRAQPPRYVVWGEGTTDEMCLGALTVR